MIKIQYVTCGNKGRRKMTSNKFVNVYINTYKEIEIIPTYKGSWDKAQTRACANLPIRTIMHALWVRKTQLGLDKAQLKNIEQILREIKAENKFNFYLFKEMW